MELDCGKCTLRSWHPEDVESLARYANNRKIWLNLRDKFPYPYTRTDAEDWIKRSLVARPETNFAIDISGQAVGGIGFERRTDIERFSAEVGYWLGEEFWGRGICTAALRIATPFALKSFQLSRIFALPFTGNLASIRVLEKTGYLREGLLRKSAYKDGRFLDQALYSYVVEA
jgi:RimJ/RimL family protein N-acetyltransferase